MRALHSFHILSKCVCPLSWCKIMQLAGRLSNDLWTPYGKESLNRKKSNFLLFAINIFISLRARSGFASGARDDSRLHSQTNQWKTESPVITVHAAAVYRLCHHTRLLCCNSGTVLCWRNRQKALGFRCFPPPAMIQARKPSAHPVSSRRRDS